MSGLMFSFWSPACLILFHKSIYTEFSSTSWFFLAVCCLLAATGDRCWDNIWVFAFSSSAYMCGSISTVLWLLALFSISPSSPLTGAIEAFRPVSFWESLLRHTLVRVFNNNKQSPVQSNLKDSKKGETCITEVLAQKRKSQDTNLFSVPVRHVSSLLPFPFFHMRWSARKYFFNYLQMFIFFWLPQGQTQSLFYYHLFFLPQSQHRAISK